MDSSDDELSLSVKQENLEEIFSFGTNHRSSFTPYKNGTTVLTNLQRGNVETRTAQFMPEEASFHVRAGMGCLTAEDFANDVNVNEVDTSNLTPLMWACAYGQLPTVKLLVQHGADARYEAENGSTPLIMAAASGHHEVVRMLLSFGADPNFQDENGNTALMFACHSDHPHCVSELLENGSDVTITNAEENSAFSIAVKRHSKQAQNVMERHILRTIENT